MSPETNNNLFDEKNVEEITRPKNLAMIGFVGLGVSRVVEIVDAVLPIVPEIVENSLSTGGFLFLVAAGVKLARRNRANS